MVLAIATFNVLFLLLFSLAVSLMNGMPYSEATFNCLAIMFDPGCISSVVDGKGETALCILYFNIAVFGLVAFSGAVIGYVSNVISCFIENANDGRNRLDLNDHVVILNWNDRGLEIINDYLLLNEKTVIVVLSSQDRGSIQKQINDTLSMTIRDKKVKNRLSVIVRQGSVLSTQQLLDSSMEKARTVILLEEEGGNAEEGGNGLTIKTLMQVSDLASKYTGRPSQKIIVEVSDEWTQAIVNEILACKADSGAEIVAVPVNDLFGNIFTQFAVMPKLNSAYSELFSNEGVEFYSRATDPTTENDFVRSYFEHHSCAIPLTVREDNGISFAFYLCAEEKDLLSVCGEPPTLRKIHLAAAYRHAKEKKIILGHNKNLENILAGIRQYNNERQADGRGVRVLLMDEHAVLEKHGFYKKYSFVQECIPVDIHQRELISERLREQMDGSDMTVLILSRSSTGEGEKDFYALANLIYLQSALNKKTAEGAFDPSSVDAVVELVEPKHHDIVQNYSRSNVVISNRYVSKMMMQLSKTNGLYGFYKDILTFDSDGQKGKEIYLKRTDSYFAELPEPMPVRDFVYSLYMTTFAEKEAVKWLSVGWTPKTAFSSFTATWPQSFCLLRKTARSLCSPTADAGAQPSVWLRCILDDAASDSLESRTAHLPDATWRPTGVRFWTERLF